MAIRRTRQKMVANNESALIVTAQNFERAGSLDQAAQFYSRLIKKKPSVEAYEGKARVSFQLKRFDDAIAALRGALRLNPTSLTALRNLAVCYGELGDYERSLTYSTRALVLAPDDALLHNNIGSLFSIMGDPHSAIPHYRRALSHPSPAIAASAHESLAFALLALGDYENGWRHHEHRRLTLDYHHQYRKLDKPFWDGQPRPGARLFITSEQGFGDQIQFARYATLAAQRGLHVILEAHPLLVDLLRSVPGVAAVSPTNHPPPPFDFQIPLMSLPHLFDTTIDNVPAAIPYLTPSTQLVDLWRDRICGDGDERLRIGLAWTGNPNQRVNARRSIDPKQLEPLLEIENTKFYSLQKGGPPFSHPKLNTPLESVVKFDETAAIVSNLDLVITVCTSIVHLAGALGKPTWLLNRSDTDWRWTLTGRTSPWYPTVRIYRQPALNAWRPVVREVGDDLRTLSKKP